VAAHARLLVLDEPTASLERRDVERLFGLVRRARGEGTGVVFISHRLDEVLALGDRVTVRATAGGSPTGRPRRSTVRSWSSRIVGRPVDRVRRAARPAPAPRCSGSRGSGAAS
jgi:ribose transport system ATP-binding protein